MDTQVHAARTTSTRALAQVTRTGARAHEFTHLALSLGLNGEAVSTSQAQNDLDISVTKCSKLPHSESECISEYHIVEVQASDLVYSWWPWRGEALRLVLVS